MLWFFFLQINLIWNPLLSTDEYSRDSGLGSSSANTSGSSSDPNILAADDDQCEPPAIVIYLVDPFTLVSDGSSGGDMAEIQRLACLGLLRCYNTVLASIPDAVRANISVQVSTCLMLCELIFLYRWYRYCGCFLQISSHLGRVMACGVTRAY